MKPAALAKALLAQTIPAIFLLVLWPALPGAQDDVRYRWERVLYGTLNGERSLLYSDSAFFGKIAFGDLDGDGDPDMLVGKSDGRINRFENRGSAGAPKLTLVAENLYSISAVPSRDGVVRRRRRAISLGSHAAPALADIDQDGDLDLVVGTGRGRVFLYLNTGNEVLPVFELAARDFVAANFGRRVVPFLADVDGDRDFDLFLGTEAGVVYFLPNIGNKKRPAFCSRFPSRNLVPGTPPPCLPTPKALNRGGGETHAAPALVDWDGDGDLDLFVGKRNGTISFFRNMGSPFVPNWRLLQERFLAIDNGGFAAPAFLDTNGDKRPELLAGNSTNQVFVYTNQDTGRLLDVWKVTGNLLEVRRVGLGRKRIVVASGDLDGDGDPDLIVGDEAGGLRWLENSGSKTDPAWRVKTANLFEGSGRRNTAPFLADLDGDGDLDLLVGGRDGRLWLVKNRGSAKAPRWHLEDNRFAGVDVGSNSTPALIDLDEDGDLDLFVGNSRGLVIFFRNDGSAAASDFRLVSTRFGAVSVGRSAAPAFFDWNRDKKPDLVVGNRAGRLVLTANDNPDGDSDLRAWALKSRFWGGFQVKAFATPHFNDFNGDGQPDLMIADGNGNLRLWLNRGFTKVKKAGTAAVAGEETAVEPEPPDQDLPLADVGGEPPENELQDTPADSERDLDALLGLKEPTGPVLPELVLATRAFGGLRFRGRAAPDFFDLDGDGDLDLVVGTGRGLLVHLNNEGSAQKPKWKRVSDHFAGYEKGRNASPVFLDLDHDGRTDLLVGNELGRVLFFRNVGQQDKPKFERQKGSLGGVNVGRNAAPSFFMPKNQERWVLLVGNFPGRLVGYLQAKGKNPMAFKKTHRRFLGLDMGISATPYFGDLERDDDVDLIVGSDDGNLLNFKKIPPTVKNPWGWQRGPGYFKGLRFPEGGTPRLADIDGDGDVDLLVGSEQGTLYFFRNDAITARGGSGP
ncbi:MAG: VCBS repeat-containing protein [bacterium]